MTQRGDGDEKRRPATSDGVPGSDLEAWRAVWEEDRPFPLTSHRGRVLGRLLVAAKRLLRPLVRAPQADLWERQRAFNLVALDTTVDLRDSLAAASTDLARLGGEVQQVQAELVADLRRLQSELNADLRRLSEDLDAFRRQGVVDVMRHSDALFARLDHKLDRLRRLAAASAGEDVGGESAD